MNALKNALLMLLVVAGGSAAGLLGARWIMAEPQRPDIETLARPAALAEHRELVVFTLSTCPACAKLKGWLGEHSVTFVEYSIDTSSEARTLAKGLDIESVPVLFTATHRINGFLPNALSQHVIASPGS